MPDNSAIGFYTQGMMAMPRPVKNHLVKCAGQPAECLLCAFIKAKIEAKMGKQK